MNYTPEQWKVITAFLRRKAVLRRYDPTTIEKQYAELDALLEETK